jgi:hypothetical protein
MSYYRFKDNDIFINGIETHPSNHFYIYSGSVFYRNTPNENATLLSGTTLSNPSASVLSVPVGSLSLFEANVNRPAILHTWDQQTQTGVQSLIFPWIVKGSDNIKWKTLATSSYNKLNYGTVMTQSYQYPLSASLSREFYPENHLASATTPAARKNLQLNPNIYNAFNTQDDEFDNGSVTVTSSYIEALKNTLNYYTHISDQYAFTGGVSPSSIFNHAFGYYGTPKWDKGVQKLNLINVPSMYYGSHIEKGTVDIKFYITGTLQGRLQDLYNNGNLVETYAIYPTFDADNPKVAGVVLYNEGVLLLTGSWALNRRDAPYEGADFASDPELLENPRWIYWGVGLTSSLNASGPSGPASQSGSVMTPDGNALYGEKSQRYSFPSASFELSFSGSSVVPVMTMLAHAPRGELYWSNNPTFTVANTSSMGAEEASFGVAHEDYISGSDHKTMSGSTFYQEDKLLEIKNINSSSFSNYTASFSKTTYVSKIGIYDKQRNLIGIAKTARPLKKEIDQDFTFKLKLDI